MMVRPFLLTAAVIGALASSGCSHKPLKAPCARDEGPMQPMAYAALEPRTEVSKAFECGPMQALNSDPSLLPRGIVK